MKRTLSRVLTSTAAAIAIPVSAVAQAPDVATIVEQFYPPSLTQFPDEIRGREQCFAVYDVDASGAPRSIVAAYTNHTEGAVRVLQTAGGGFQVVADTPAGLDLDGVRCDVTLEDVNADGRKEIRVDFSVNRAVVSWLFSWDGQQLLNLTPTAGLGIIPLQASMFVNGDLVDVDNDGVKEIHVQPEYPRFPDEPVLPGQLFKLIGNQYAASGPIVGMWELVRRTSAPETSTLGFTLPSGASGPYTLRVVSGLPDGSARATSARVSVNGTEILSPTDFGNNVAVIERPVSLASENELIVRFAGQPSSQMLIVMESTNWQ